MHFRLELLGPSTVEVCVWTSQSGPLAACAEAVIVCGSFTYSNQPVKESFLLLVAARLCLCAQDEG